jgi:hypothetical protein
MDGTSGDTRTMRWLRRVIFGALAVTVYRRLIVYERPLYQRPPAPRAGAGVRLGLLSATDVDDYRHLCPDTPSEEVTKRLARGDRCFVARLNGDLVSVRWLSTKRADVEYLGLSFSLGAAFAYAYDAFTAPALRQTGLSTIAAAYMGEQARSEGCRALLSAIGPENEGGRRLLKGLGGRPVGMVGCLRLGPLRLPLRRLPPGYLD